MTPERVRALIAAQFPQWADLPVSPVAWSGWDNRTFHLGTELLVRLPSAPGYAPQVDKEQRWLPWLTSRLPLPIPAPLGWGQPSSLFPGPWSVYRWLPGQSVLEAQTVERQAGGPPLDRVTLAQDLAAFLRALFALPAEDGPAAGAHSCFRGAPLAVYDAETRSALAQLAGVVDVPAAQAIWEEALVSAWTRPPVWFHGDVAAGNLLVQGGRLSAVIDFGCLGVGDPACDLAVAWTLFEGPSRVAFRAALPLDRGTWTRGRGWALWKALITLAASREVDESKAAEARRVLAEVLKEA